MSILPIPPQSLSIPLPIHPHTFPTLPRYKHQNKNQSKARYQSTKYSLLYKKRQEIRILMKKIIIKHQRQTQIRS